MLTTYYGDVPLILAPPDVEAHALLPPSPPGQVVEQISEDLDRAAALLPSDYPTGDAARATRGAALGLTARILLYEARPLLNPDQDPARWQAAAAAAEEVISINQYALFPDYHTLFLPDNENSEEVLFDVQYISPTVEPGLGTSWDLINIQQIGRAHV